METAQDRRTKLPVSAYVILSLILIFLAVLAWRATTIRQNTATAEVSGKVLEITVHAPTDFQSVEKCGIFSEGGIVDHAPARLLPWKLELTLIYTARKPAQESGPLKIAEYQTTRIPAKIAQTELGSVHLIGPGGNTVYQGPCKLM